MASRSLQGYEWTVEANPGDLDLEKIDVLAAQGVNRLSLGSQSFRTREAYLCSNEIIQPTTFASRSTLCRQAGITSLTRSDLRHAGRNACPMAS